MARTVTYSFTATDSNGHATTATHNVVVESAEALKVIGMSAPASAWSQRLAEVGAQGINARRIFADLNSNGQDQSDLIGQAIAAGMMPVISYKVPSVTTLISGGYDTWLTALRNYLNGLGVPVTVTFWHEPHGDMDPADFRAGSTKFLTVKSSTIKVGPILNGWLLDNQVSTFASYASAALLDAWDFMGVDTYQPGTVTAPDNSKMPGRAIPLMVNWLTSQGHGTKPVLVGEYNGFTTEAIEAAGDYVLACPTLWVACVWNSSGGLGVPLSGDRLTAFKATKADPTVQQ